MCLGLFCKWWSNLISQMYAFLLPKFWSSENKFLTLILMFPSGLKALTSITLLFTTTSSIHESMDEEVLRTDTDKINTRNWNILHHGWNTRPCYIQFHLYSLSRYCFPLFSQSVYSPKSKTITVYLLNWIAMSGPSMDWRSVCRMLFTNMLAWC